MMNINEARQFPFPNLCLLVCLFSVSYLAIVMIEILCMQYTNME